MEMAVPDQRDAEAGTPATERVQIDCPLCGSKRFRVLYTPKRQVDDPAELYGAASGIRDTQTVVQCLDCPLIYENPRLPEAAILEGYSNSSEAGHDSQHSMRKRSFLKALHSLAKLVPPPGARVLDVGTAGGAFLEAAQMFGYDAHGLEPSRYLVEQGKARGLKIEQGTIRNNAFTAGAFDMITFWDVLEHLAEPRQSLEQIRPLLKEGGVLLINYPDIGTWQAKLAGERFWWLLSVHLTHFNRSSIREICRRTGYQVVAFKPYWQTLEFGYLQQIAVQLKAPLSGPVARVTPGFLRRIPIPYYASQTTCIACRS